MSNKNKAVTASGNAPKVIVKHRDKDLWLVSCNKHNSSYWTGDKSKAGIFNHSEISSMFSRETKRLLECEAV